MSPAAASAAAVFASVIRVVEGGCVRASMWNGLIADDLARGRTTLAVARRDVHSNWMHLCRNAASLVELRAKLRSLEGGAV